jgi:hypothetical protein
MEIEPRPITFTTVIPRALWKPVTPRKPDAELRPPPEHTDKPWHLVQATIHDPPAAPEPAYWERGQWNFFGMVGFCSPTSDEAGVFRYVGPIDLSADKAHQARIRVGSPTFTRTDGWKQEYSDCLLIYTQDQSRHIATLEAEKATLEAENITLRAQLAGRVSISCADAANVLAVVNAAPPLVPLVPLAAKAAMPSNALAHRKPQIGLRIS